jgi:hypothetical protein
MMRRCIIAVAAATAVLAVPPSLASGFTLKPGQTRSYRCVNNGGHPACVTRITARDGIRLRYLPDVPVAGCWSHPWTAFESCTVITDCRLPRCWAYNGSHISVNVRLGRTR